MIVRSFKGQTRVSFELETYLNNIKLGHNANILVFAPSGYGKTSFVKIALEITHTDYVYKSGVLPHKLYPDKVMVIDECHVIKESFEYLYPYMDSGKYSFIFMTNLLDGIPDAIKTRCFILTFDDYTEETIARILREYFTKASDDLLRSLAIKVLLNPRIAHQTATRIKTIIGNKTDITDKDINKALKAIGVKEYEPLTQRYVDFLRNIGQASIDTIARGTGLSKDMIASIESFLIKRHVIEITSRGRVWKG